MPSAFSRRSVMHGIVGALFYPAVARARTRANEVKRNEHERFEITQTELKVKGLDPAHDGLVIAQLSDIHLGRGCPDGRVISAVRALNEAEPDLAISPATTSPPAPTRSSRSASPSPTSRRPPSR